MISCVLRILAFQNWFQSLYDEILIIDRFLRVVIPFFLTKYDIFDNDDLTRLHHNLQKLRILFD